MWGAPRLQLAANRMCTSKDVLETGHGDRADLSPQSWLLHAAAARAQRRVWGTACCETGDETPAESGVTLPCSCTFS